MPVGLTDTLIASARALGNDGARVWDFISKLQENPAHPGLSLERITQAAEKGFWSGRISQSLRAVLLQDGDSYTVLYAGRHDDAYQWARTHSFERNAATGEVQIVTAPEVLPPIPPNTAPPAEARRLFAAHKDAYLLSLGLPPNWLPTIREITTEDQLLQAIEALPDAVAERLLELADGKLVTPPAPSTTGSANSEPGGERIYLLASTDELRRLLEAPLATWLVFLHPSQQRLAVGSFRGPLKITGSAGTGKTVVALHRAQRLAAQGKRVLLTSYVTTLCANLERNLELLCTPRERALITVGTVHSRAHAIVQAAGRRVEMASEEELREAIALAQARLGSPLDMDLLEAEWRTVIQAQGLTSWDQYRGASRVGRGTPLNVKERKQVWAVMAEVRSMLQRRGKLDWPDLCRLARELLGDGAVPRPFDAVIVDEAQDLGPQELLLLAALGGDGPDNLTLVGDGGQRLYGRPISLRSLGIDVRGRSHVLRLNYRTTQQIRRFADRILAGMADDLDGAPDDRRGVRSLVGGPEPTLRGFAHTDEQSAYVVDEITRLLESGLHPEEMGVFARKRDLLEPLKTRLRAAGLRYHVLSANEAGGDGVNLGTMHRAKGLEFKAVFIIDASDDQLPQGRAYKGLSDPVLREEAVQRERQLLYVSATRARDELYITWVGERSRFLA